MTLTLRAVSLNDLPLSQPITARFDATGGTIGRADNNTMALPDPERHISRQQAEISAGAGGYVIRNVGSANPITVSGQAVSQGQSVPLRHLDQVRIGGYLLEVQSEADADSGATVIRRAPDLSRPATLGPSPAPAPAALSSSNPFADLFGGAPSTDVFDTSPAPAPHVSAFAAPAVQAPPPAPVAPMLLPDDFDPFAPPVSAPSSPPFSPPSSSRSAPATSSAGGLPSSFDPFGGLDLAPPPVPNAPPARNDDLGFGGAFADLVPGDNNRSLDDLFGLRRVAYDAQREAVGPRRGGVVELGERRLVTEPGPVQEVGQAGRIAPGRDALGRPVRCGPHVFHVGHPCAVLVRIGLVGASHIWGIITESMR